MERTQTFGEESIPSTPYNIRPPAPASVAVLSAQKRARKLDIFSRSHITCRRIARQTVVDNRPLLCNHLLHGDHDYFPARGGRETWGSSEHPAAEGSARYRSDAAQDPGTGAPQRRCFIATNLKSTSACSRHGLYQRRNHSRRLGAENSRLGQPYRSIEQVRRVERWRQHSVLRRAGRLVLLHRRRAPLVSRSQEGHLDTDEALPDQGGERKPRRL